MPRVKGQVKTRLICLKCGKGWKLERGSPALCFHCGESSAPIAVRRGVRAKR